MREAGAAATIAAKRRPMQMRCEEHRRVLLVATDGSPGAEAAVEKGVQLAAEQGAGRIVFLHVEPTDLHFEPRTARVEAVHEERRPTRDPALRHAADVAREAGVPFELRLVSGLCVPTILDVADELDAELTALGSSRHSALSDVLLGSICKELLRRAKPPVLVVQPTYALAEALERA
jgi:nucleotide-binding universal stress UspA family protein